MKWINCESGERPDDDQTVLGRHEKFPNHLPEFICWFAEEEEFMPIDPHSRLPVKITHWMHLPLPPNEMMYIDEEMRKFTEGFAYREKNEK